MWISRQINDRKSHPTTKYAFMHYSCAPVHTGIYNRDHYHIHWWSLSLDVALVSYLTTVFPFGLNHSAKVSLNTSCFLYVSDRDVWFCFIMMIFFDFWSTAPKWDNPRFHEGLSLLESEHTRFTPSLSLLVLRLGGTRVTIHSAPAPV